MQLDFLYKNLYNLNMANEQPKSRVKWEGDSLEEIRTWSEDAKQNVGGDLRRLEDREDPLDSKPMGAVLPGVSELRDRDKDFWYRLFYALEYGLIYVLHCFKKKSNQTSKSDIKIAKQRLATVLKRDEPSARKEKKSA
jgi:phage-related protein